jgi:hypothetical protein
MATTKLGSALASPPAPAASAASRFMAALQGRRPMKPITIPGLDLPAVMVIVGSERMLDLEGESLRAMESRGIPRIVMNEARFELDLALRVLAEAIVESKENPVAIGTLAEWGKLPPETIVALWLEYTALREEFDPADVELTKAEIEEIHDAVVKKNATLLRYFGPRRLASYLLSTSEAPASSPEPRSSPGDSSSES